MGLARLSRELKRARGTMSQKAAAAHWQVPYSTLCVLEQGKPRNYQSHTLAQFDVMLGRSAKDLYDLPDEAGWDVPAASVVAVEELRARLDELAAVVTQLRNAIVHQPPGLLEELGDLLEAAELEEVIAFAHFLAGRRRPKS
jgi:hypothetical protein